MGEAAVEDDSKSSSGCGLLLLYNNVFRRRNSVRQSAPASPASPHLTHPNSRRGRSGSDEATLLSSGTGPQPYNVKVAVTPLYQQQQQQQQQSRLPGTAGKPFPSSSGRARCTAIAAELDSMIHDHQRNKGSNTLVRASSGNVMLYGNLGNLRAPGAGTPNQNVLDFLPMTAKELSESNANAKQGAATGGGARKNMRSHASPQPAAGAAAATPEVLCRALSVRQDPEELKEKGNEEYKQGNYADAADYYERAIFIDPSKPTYWSNKAAALIAMGQLLDAIGDCKEAVRIDPSFGRAHQRLGTLYLRLGLAEKAINQYKLARNDAGPQDFSRAHTLQALVAKCNDSHKQMNWQTLLKDAQAAVSAGADSSPKLFCFQGEALLALQRPEEAEATLKAAPKFDSEASLKTFGAASNAYFLAVRALVHIASGRFEDAVAVSQSAARLDPNSREANTTARKARLVASARSKGNELFKAAKFQEACVAYQEGLSHDPYNAILLCNQAACQSKLGHWEKAIEDCNAALKLRPSYTKARLRRADCNAKLERWEASIEDYEALVQEMPEDEEVAKALSDAEMQLRKQQSGGEN